MSTDQPITLYVIRGSAECDAARACLEACAAAFVELDVHEDADALRELLKAAGEAVVPTLVAGADVQIGFDQCRYEDMVANPLPPDDDRLSVLKAVLDPDRASALLGLEPDFPRGRPGDAILGPNASGGTPVVSDEVEDYEG